jgi:Na+-transporting NADH:ubiquinone oxidoreductase subunit C
MKKDGITYTVIFTFLITLVFVGILAFVNGLTRKQIEQNNEIVFKRAVLNAFHINYSDNKDLLSKYGSEITENTIKYNEQDIVIYSMEKVGNTYYSVLFRGSGLWGTITGILSVNSSITEIIGMDIISHNETPGLGGRIDEAWFKQQFTNLQIPDNSIHAITSGTKGEGEIDAVSGATLTSRLLEKMINNTLGNFKNYLELLDG